jgi:carboxymethylenebutenolidase
MTRTQPDGYLSTPPSGKGKPVIVLHAWWGLNDTIRAYCNHLTASGFSAFAPDLYHGQIADNIADAEALSNALEANDLKARAEISNAVFFLNEH